MAVRNQALKQKQAVNAAPGPAPKWGTVKAAFTMRHLRQMSLWGATAASALILAVLSSRSEIGSHRAGAAFSSLAGGDQVQVAAPRFDAQAETRRLAEAVRDLKSDDGRLKSRLAAVEQNMDDITGSVTRQIEAAKTRTANSWPVDANPAPITPPLISSILAPAAPASPVTPPAAKTASPEAVPSAYGVDIGSALSIQVLRARWLGIRSAHPQLFEGLTPTVMLRETPSSKRIELRLVVGPLADSAAAARLCAALAPYRLLCQPTAFDRQHIALQ